jgi:hypothetical protein
MESAMIPEEIEWPNRGKAIRLRARGMSDYGRCDPNAVYEIKGQIFRLMLVKGKWKAQSRRWTTHWKDTPEEAIQDIEKNEL